MFVCWFAHCSQYKTVSTWFGGICSSSYSRSLSLLARSTCYFFNIYPVRLTHSCRMIFTDPTTRWGTVVVFPDRAPPSFMCARSSCHSLTDESSRVKEHQIRKENHKKQRDKQSNTVACCVSFTVLCTLHRVCCILLLLVRPKQYLLIGYLILTHPCLPVQQRFDSRSLSVWLAGCSLVPLVHRVLIR